MASISIKGIIVGALFGLVTKLILGAAMGFAIATIFGPEAALDIPETAADFVAASRSRELNAPVLVLNLIISVAAGYVAARAAGRGELVNAGLANLIVPVIVAFVAVTSRPDVLMTSLVDLAVLRLFGVLGGYMRLRQVARAA